MACLYRYFGAKNAHEALGLLVDLVENNVLWASSPLGFNDPLEFSVRVPPSRDSRQLQIGIQRNMSDLCRVLCFSEKQDNRLMLSHYSGNHKSFCAEFDSDILTKSSEPKPQWIMPVEYSKEPPFYDFETPFNDFVRTLIGTKDKEWEYEKEHRFIYFLVPPQDNAPSYRTPDELPASLKIKFDRSALKRIILGCRAFPILLDYVKSQASITSPSWAKMIQSHDKYELQLGPLDT